MDGRRVAGESGDEGDGDDATTIIGCASKKLLRSRTLAAAPPSSLTAVLAEADGCRSMQLSQATCNNAGATRNERGSEAARASERAGE